MPLEFFLNVPEKPASLETDPAYKIIARLFFGLRCNVKNLSSLRERLLIILEIYKIKCVLPGKEFDITDITDILKEKSQTLYLKAELNKLKKGLKETSSNKT